MSPRLKSDFGIVQPAAKVEMPSGDRGNGTKAEGARRVDIVEFAGLALLGVFDCREEPDGEELESAELKGMATAAAIMIKRLIASKLRRVAP